MYIGKKQILYVLIALLGVLYVANIFLLGSITSTFVVKPVKLDFLVIQAPAEECQGCTDGENIVTRIDATHNIKYTSQTVTPDSTIAQKAIENYAITSLPAVIITGDITNQQITGSWKALGAKVNQNNVIIQQILPFYDIQKKAPIGVVNAILITDNTCTDCFNEKTYLNIFTQFGIFMNDVQTYDISSAKGSNIVSKYGITKVPAVLLSSGAGVYNGFTQAWGEVGTRADDGWYVFREVQKLGLKYTDIK